MPRNNLVKGLAAPPHRRLLVREFSVRDSQSKGGGFENLGGSVVVSIIYHYYL
jgi:hypothetical protein